MNKMALRIKQGRLELGLTQTELGAMVGVAKNAVCKWETGAVEGIPIKKVSRLAEIFHVSPTYLMGLDDIPNQTLTKDETEVLQMLHDRPEMNMMFKAGKNVSKENILMVAKMLEALNEENEN